LNVKTCFTIFRTETRARARVDPELGVSVSFIPDDWILPGSEQNDAAGNLETRSRKRRGCPPAAGGGSEPASAHKIRSR